MQEPQLPTTSPSYILSIREPLEELYRRAGTRQEDKEVLFRLIDHAWYAVLYPNQLMSNLMNFAVRLRDRGHPYSPGVCSFGLLLQKELEHFCFYQPEVHLRTYHFVRRHGRWAIVIKRSFDDHLALMFPGDPRCDRT